ncbi:hypothetical protein BV898_15868 [Hypsibius exemplaris]|uniref:Uncharacterized protein n=1 Tax=Hypsibius exemplaris TaxID=2072580 RepID=A0A9X6NES3_HYPEX|nr:hypothetical protein BV898_15868 [Hypsibius exemplaris]
MCCCCSRRNGSFAVAVYYSVCGAMGLAGGIYEMVTVYEWTNLVPSINILLTGMVLLCGILMMSTHIIGSGIALAIAGETIGRILGLVVGIAIQAYFIYVIASYQRELLAARIRQDDYKV